MRHRKTKVTLDRTSAQRRRLFRDLAIALVTKERITTTAARAKATRSIVERLITTGKTNDLHHRRLLLHNLNHAGAAKKILDNLGPRFRARRGGYTRQVKLSPRRGDGANLVMIELIQPADHAHR